MLQDDDNADGQIYQETDHRGILLQVLLQLVVLAAAFTFVSSAPGLNVSPEFKYGVIIIVNTNIDCFETVNCYDHVVNRCDI